MPISMKLARCQFHQDDHFTDATRAIGEAAPKAIAFLRTGMRSHQIQLLPLPISPHSKPHTPHPTPHTPHPTPYSLLPNFHNQFPSKIKADQ
ncbi:hypothetical protein [Moorena sp. SIO3H5]|uniref:hypothetical protein n=1 Tax=Moorena sp. SIO3H5 TaxID=2607834 RepID=UPI0013BBC842|nr:hypothetical protein [Moorena sp. SIO3H5]NEO69538.1 hypothetical protein [Moorena sp. SIO3H5]